MRLGDECVGIGGTVLFCICPQRVEGVSVKVSLAEL